MAEEQAQKAADNAKPMAEDASKQVEGTAEDVGKKAQPAAENASKNLQGKAKWVLEADQLFLLSAAQRFIQP